MLASPSDVGTVKAHPSLCGRCVENIDGQGKFANLLNLLEKVPNDTKV